MLRFQITLVIILVGCIAFLSCGRIQDKLDPVTEEMQTDMTTEMMMDMEMHKSWMHVMLPAPTMTVAEAAAAMDPGGTGQAHGMGTRTVYFNEVGAMANKDETITMYPVGTMIVKEIMDDTNMFVQKIAKMTKTDDPMYADHGGWMYVKYARASETDAYMMVGGGSLEGSTGCYGCHTKAAKDSVFVSLSMKDDEMPEGNGAGTGNGANGNGANGNGANGNGNGANGNGAGNGGGTAQ